MLSSAEEQEIRSNQSTHGVPHTGPEDVTINGVKYTITADEVEALKSIYNETGTPNGVEIALNEVLVDTGRIPDDTKTKNLAWYPIARIVGHRVPSQQRD